MNEDVGLNYNTRDTMISDMAKTLSDKFDNSIVQALEINGYTFKNKYELIDFAKTRCRVEYFKQTKTSQLYADNNLVAEWCDQIDTKIEGTTITSIFRKFRIITNKNQQ